LEAFTLPDDAIAYEVFDLKTRKWEPVRCMSNDPWDLMEFTVPEQR